MTEYSLSDNGKLLWGLETVPYSEAPTTLNYFGIVEDAIEFPNPNPQKAHGTKGHRRGPYVHSGLQREYQFPVPIKPIDARAPLECAIGPRVKADAGPVGYQTMSNSEGTYAGTESIATGIYKVRVTVDGVGPTEMDVDLTGGKTVTELMAIWQTILRSSSVTLATVELDSGLIKVSGVTEGASGSILIQEGTSVGLLAALTLIAGVNNVIDGATAGITDSYSYTFEETNKIADTITIYRGQSDTGVTQKYIGCKGSIGLKCAGDDAFMVTLDIVATHYLLDEAAIAFLDPVPVMPVIEPYRMWNLKDATISLAGSTVFKDLLSITGFDLKIDNGLKAKPTRGHLRDSSTWSREAYVIVEENGAEKYDMKFDLMINDSELLKAIYDDDQLYDVHFKLMKNPDDETETWDIYLYNCKFGDLPFNSPQAGAIEGTVPILCKDTKVVVTTEESITVT